MTHSDPDVLAMMAMGESDLPEADVRHIESCAECLSEMRSLHRVADLARSGRPDEPFATPSPAVWDRISVALDLDSSIRPVAQGDAADGASGAVTHPDADFATRRRARRRGGRGVRIAVSVAAIAAVAATITTVVVLQRTLPSVVAEARLVSPPGGASHTGEAVIERRADGVRDVRIDIDYADVATAGDSYREVWLISSDLSRLVSLGTLEGTDGRFVVPDSVDLADFPIVDISDEPLDGDPLHSGDSILRGTLDS